jgi:hypothetical protein
MGALSDALAVTAFSHWQLTGRKGFSKWGNLNRCLFNLCNSLSRITPVDNPLIQGLRLHSPPDRHILPLRRSHNVPTWVRNRTICQALSREYLWMDTPLTFIRSNRSISSNIRSNISSPHTTLLKRLHNTPPSNNHWPALQANNPGGVA